MKTKMKTKRRTIATGATAIEILIVIAIAVILTAIAIPNYQTYVANNQASVLSLEINNALRLAKNEALRLNMSVKVCALAATGSTTCNDTASSWKFGWQIIVPSTNTVIHTFQPSNANSVIITPSSSIVFLPSGLPTPQSFSFSIQPTGCSQGFSISYETTTPGEVLQTKTIGC